MLGIAAIPTPANFHGQTVSLIDLHKTRRDDKYVQPESPAWKSWGSGALERRDEAILSRLLDREEDGST